MILFLHGPEAYVLRDKLAQIKSKAAAQGIDAANTVEFPGGETELETIRQAVLTEPFGARQRLVIVRNWLLERSADESAALAELAGQVPDTTILAIVEAGEPDKRRSAFKQLQRLAAKSWAFPSLDTAGAERWLGRQAKQKGVMLPAAAARKLVSFTGTDGWSLATELDKLATAAGGKEISEPLIDELVTQQTPADVFALVDALGHRNAKAALGTLRHLLDSGEPPLRVFAMIIRQYRILIGVKDLLEQKKPAPAIAKELGVHPFVVGKAARQANQFSLPELKEIYGRLAELDYHIKTGRREPETALELFVAEACGTTAKLSS